MNAPGSPSSALQITYFCPVRCFAAVSHFSPVGNPPPPRPRRPAFFTSVTTSAGVHGRHDLMQRLVSVHRDIFIDVLRIDRAAVAQRNPLLFAEELNLMQRFDPPVSLQATAGT